MRIFALDISSTTIGWAVLDILNTKISFFAGGFIKPPKEGHLFERLKKTQIAVQALLKLYQPDHCAIEEIAQFIPRKSTANTIITLAVFNRAVGMTVYEFLGKPPIFYPVMTIRHGIKEGIKPPAKEDIPKLVEKLLSIKIPREYNRNNKVRVELYDRADAIAVGLYACRDLTQTNMKPKRKKAK